MDANVVDRILAGRGGVHQRASRGQPDDFESEGLCDLVDALLYLFDWQQLNEPEIQWPADCACRASADHPELTTLQNIGAKGRWPRT